MDHCDEGARAAELFHHFPESITTDYTKSLREVNEACVEVKVSLHELSLELVSNKYHVCSPSTWAEAVSAMWEVALLKVFQQTVEEDTRQVLENFRLERYSSVVVKGLVVSFVLIEMYDCGIREFLWQ